MAEKAALITGGSSGIGLAIARALGEDGYGITLSARRAEKLEAAAEELRSAGIDVLAHPINMADEEGIAELLTAHKERYGRLDVLANNAGVGIGQAMAELGTKQVDMQLDVNLRGVIIVSAGTCSLTNSVIGVSTKPGHRAVDLIPSAASSLFIAWVKPTTPCLVAE